MGQEERLFEEGDSGGIPEGEWERDFLLYNFDTGQPMGAGSIAILSHDGHLDVTFGAKETTVTVHSRGGPVVGIAEAFEGHSRIRDIFVDRIAYHTAVYVEQVLGEARRAVTAAEADYLSRRSSDSSASTEGPTQDRDSHGDEGSWMGVFPIDPNPPEVAD